MKQNDALTQIGGDVMQSAIDAFEKANSVPQIQCPTKGANLCEIKNGCFICDRLFCEGHKCP